MHRAAKSVVLLGCPVDSAILDGLRQHYEVHYAPDKISREKAARELGAKVQAVITNGTQGWTADLMDLTPNLRVITALGAGIENIDAHAARERSISVTSGRGANVSSVADHAIALLFAVVRDIPYCDQATREGQWTAIRSPRPDLAGARLGIIGLGDIGAAVARKLAGFEMEVSYHNRHPRKDSPYRYVECPVKLAESVDFLISCLPGGEGTTHLIDESVLLALGRSGYFVNVGRGSVVDSEALASALRTGSLAGAALDVFEGEPNLRAALKTAPNLIITPHIAGFSPKSNAAYVRLAVENIEAILAESPP